MSKIQNPKVGDLVDIITPDEFKVKMQIFEFDWDKQTITLGIPNTNVTSSIGNTTIFLNRWQDCRIGESLFIKSSNKEKIQCTLRAALKNGRLIISIEPKAKGTNVIRNLLQSLISDNLRIK